MVEILKGLKYTFLVEALVLLLFGIFFVFFIDTYVVLFEWPYLDPIAGHYIGAFVLGVAVCDLLAFRETNWEKIELFVILHMIWLLIASVIFIWGLITDYTWSVLFNAFLQWIFLIAFVFFYFKHKK